MLSKLNRIYRSVFAKLLLIIFITGVLMNILALVLFFRERFYHFRIPLGKNIVNYVNYLIDDLGHPPSLEKAKRISEAFLYDISFSSGDESWSTSDMPQPLSHFRDRIMYQTPHAKIVLSRGNTIVTVEKEYGRFIFTSNRYFFITESTSHHLIFAVVISGCLLVAFLLIRRILKPITALTKGVREVSAGNLSHKVLVKNSDELGELADAFNTMTDKISHMLTNREQLLLDVSHELRTPLTRMKVALEFTPAGKARDTLDADVSEMETMVTEILESARLRNRGQDLKPVHTDLSELVRHIAGKFETQPPAIVITHLDAQCICKVDPEAIGTVVKNIIMNALKYSHDKSAPVKISLKKDPEGATLTVHDNGIGIPTADLPHIFEPFYRVDKSRSKRTGGYGLGLSLCKSIMDAHSGQIAVESKEGEGTIVVLTFRKLPPAS